MSISSSFSGRRLRLRFVGLFCAGCVLLAGSALAALGQTPKTAAPQGTPGQSKPPAAGPAAPQSRHYPILLFATGVATGTDPSWSTRIGQKGPEVLERVGYPPILLEAAEVTPEGADAWAYHAKDSATGAAIAIHIVREACTDGPPPADGTPSVKYTFRASFDHAQIGTLTGCARTAPELFPKLTNQTTTDDEDETKKPPPPPSTAITNSKPPTAVAFVNSTGKIIVSRAGVRKVAAPGGAELALSHDGKKLLYTRGDSKDGQDRALVLYDFTTGRSQELFHGGVRQAFWSPDDSRIAFLHYQDQKWQIWACPAASPEQAAPFDPQNVSALHGWSDNHTLLATDSQNAYWIADDKPLQTVTLKDLYGNAFQIMSSDTLRINPANPDLLVVSAAYAAPAAGVPTDAMGLAYGFFLYEVRSKRRILLSPPDQWARAAEWSRDGVQAFYTRRISATASTTFRVFWDGSGVHHYIDGTDLVVGQ